MLSLKTFVDSHLHHTLEFLFCELKKNWVFACVLLAMSVFKLEAWDNCTLYVPRQLIWWQLGCRCAHPEKTSLLWVWWIVSVVVSSPQFRPTLLSNDSSKYCQCLKWLLILDWIHSIPLLLSFIWFSWRTEDCYVEHKLYSGNLQYELQWTCNLKLILIIRVLQIVTVGWDSDELRNKKLLHAVYFTECMRNKSEVLSVSNKLICIHFV